MADSESTCLGKRSRQRAEPDHEMLLRRDSKQEAGEGWVNDEDFYFPDGDIIVLADRTRFKLSRFVLKRGSSLMERALLESPDPVTITTRETAEDIRALSFVTHCFPVPEKTPINQLIAVLYICHRLQFFSHAEWAIQAIFKSTFLSSESTETDDLDEPDEALKDILIDASENDIAKLLAALARCAIPGCPICKHTAETYIPAVCAVWLSFLQTDTSMPTRRAIDCAESFGLRSFLGRLYYTQIVITNARATARCDTPATTVFEDNMLDLTAEQTAALYRGYWSISRFWDSVRNPPEVDTYDQPSHDRECVSAWEEMWNEGIHGDGKSPYWWNPIGALLQLSKMGAHVESERYAVNKDNVARCACFFRKEARRMRQQLLATLADHFLPPTDPSRSKVTVEATAHPPLVSVITIQQSQYSSTQAHASRKPQTAKPQQLEHQGQTKKQMRNQRKRQAKAAKKACTDDTSTILLRTGLELQHTSRVTSTRTVGQTVQVSTEGASPELSRIGEPFTSDRDLPEHQPSEGRVGGTADVSSALERESVQGLPEVIVIESTPPPPSPPPLDRAASPEYWAESDREIEPSQNYLFFRGGAQPAKIPKAMFDHHGRPIQNFTGIGDEDAEMSA